MSALAKLKQLTHMYINNNLLLAEDPTPDHAPAAAYTGFTASHKLKSLLLEDHNLPEGAWQYVLTPKQPLSHLTTLYLEAVREGINGALPATAMTS